MTNQLPDAELQWLLAEVNHPASNHDKRAEVGDKLAEGNDPRPGVGLTEGGLPDVAWLAVDGGRMPVQGAREPFNVRPFYIGKYSVTYSQYQAFMDAEDGYSNWAWWQGLQMPEDTCPQDRPFPNHPAENVTWYEAVAFCRWMTSWISQQQPDDTITGEVVRQVREAGWEIRLPAEWEWQQAATGGDAGRRFPWGSERDEARANTAEGNLGRTTAVGMYPHGAAPVGTLDMSGNVWEWCLNEFDDPTKVKIGGGARRVIRGGSWFHYLDSARCIARDSYTPEHCFNLIGFRIVCARPLYQFRDLTTQHVED